MVPVIKKNFNSEKSFFKQIEKNLYVLYSLYITRIEYKNPIRYQYNNLITT